MIERPARVFHLLLVEDEKNVGATLVERLEREGFLVQWATTVEQARQNILAQSFDLALLDVGLPDGTGFDVAEILRRTRPATAIVFVTALGTPEDRIRGLELGAEDYVVKPFHSKELVLRIRNALKRVHFASGPQDGKELTAIVGQAKVHFYSFEAEINGRRYSLTHKETAVLRLLVEKRGHVVSRDDILNHAWSEDEFPTPRTVDNFIVRLRRLVEVNSEQPCVIKSIRGIGYQLL